jgi:hypothetical protein
VIYKPDNITVLNGWKFASAVKDYIHYFRQIKFLFIKFSSYSFCKEKSMQKVIFNKTPKSGDFLGCKMYIIRPAWLAFYTRSKLQIEASPGADSRLSLSINS